MPSVLELMFWPLRSVIRAVGSDPLSPLEETDHEILEGVKAIRHATDSLERHVEVIEVLATSVGPLTESVDRLNETMRDLVALLGPMAAAQRGVQAADRDVQRVEHTFGFHRHKKGTGESSPDDAES